MSAIPAVARDARLNINGRLSKEYRSKDLWLFVSLKMRYERNASLQLISMEVKRS